MVKLLTEIAKADIHQLGKRLETKFILTVSKILTGSPRKILRDAGADFKDFVETL